jgi:UDP-3-O-[3-hydroxymyristoyl] glucosamine N-acyltransferase
MKLSDLAQKIGAELVGDGQIEIASAGTLDEAGPGQITFLSNPKYNGRLQTTRASAAVVSPSVCCEGLALLRAEDPYFAFSQALVALHGHRRHPFEGVHPRAHVDPTATVGEGSVLYPGVFVGPRVRIGRDCVLHANVVVYEECVIGDRVIIHAGTSIGHDGFGYATQQGVHHKIPQVGNVLIEDDVEIGANCAIERAAMGSTIIGRGTKFCDLIAIGHGTKIGSHGLVVAQVGIAGSTTIGHHVIIGGQAAISGHLNLGDHVSIGGRSGVHQNLPDRSRVLGVPAMPLAKGRRALMLHARLPELADRIRKLEKALGQQVEEEPREQVEEEPRQ